ncbi:MAG: hypothetical protein ABEJ47_00110 [Halorhabdus sp.]
MTLLKRVAVAVVAIMMVLSIAGASVAFAINGTVLDSDYVTETFEKEGVYEAVASEGQERISEQLDTTLANSADEIPAGISITIDTQAAADAALPKAYVAEQFSTNVERAFAYLQGDAGNLTLSVDLVPVKRSLKEYVTNDTITVDTVALANARDINVTTAGVTVDSRMITRLNRNRSGYERARIRLRSQAVAAAAVPVSIGANGSVVVNTSALLRQTEFEIERNGVRADTAMLVRLNANQSGYRNARADLRSQALTEAEIPLDIARDGSVEVDIVEISREIDFTSNRANISIDDGTIARLNANRSGYHNVRVNIRQQALEQFPVDVNENGSVVVNTVDIVRESNVTYDRANVTVDDGMIARLNANRSGYHNVRVNIRQQAVEQFPVDVNENGSVVVNTVDIAREIDFASATDRITVTDDMIARLNNGSSGYAAVRSDIREQVREQLPSMATAAQVDAVLEEINAELTANVTSRTRATYGENVSEETLDDIIALQTTVIDGLTDPDLTAYDQYATRREADEAALEQSFDRELDSALREANAEMKDAAAEQIRSEYGTDVGNETIEDIIALQNTVIDGLTQPDLAYDEYTNQREDDEAALAASFDRELDEALREANAQIKATAAEQARDRYGDTLSNTTLADVIALQNTTIDGLTKPDLTYDEYTTRRDANEAALEQSLTTELQKRLREANARIKAEAADQVRSEYGDVVSNATLADIIALQNTTIDGLTQPNLTYAEYTTQREAAEAALAASFDRELTNRLEAAATDVKEAAAERLRNEYGDVVSTATLADVIALQNTVIDGLTQPGLTYDEYVSRREAAEAALEASLAAELDARIDERVDDRIQLGTVTGERADVLSYVQTGVGVLGTLTLVLPLAFLALAGLVYVITRSIHRTVATAGYSLLVAGIGGVAVGILARGPVVTLVDSAFASVGGDLPEVGIEDAIVRIVEGLFGTLTMQSVVLAILGVVLVVAVVADRRGAVEKLRALVTGRA